MIYSLLNKKACYPIVLLALVGNAQANPFSNGNAEFGRGLMVDKKCEACHVGKVGGDGSLIYSRPDRKVTTTKKLAAQVAFCNTETNAGLFPDDEENISAFLNQRHYKFKE